LSTLVYEPLDNYIDVVHGQKTELFQSIMVANHLGIYNPIIKPYLFFTGMPSGIFKLGIYSMAMSLVAEKTFTSVDMLAQLGGVGTAGHLYFNIKFDGLKLAYGSYILKLSQTEYTFSRTNAIGWCKEWENIFDKNPDINLVEWTQRPFAVRIISLTPREV
jgi:hypothetical protein